MKMKKLLVISNHPPENWGLAQKGSWDIKYIPFPNVPPMALKSDVDKIAASVISKILDTGITNLSIQGDFYLFSILYGRLAYELETEFMFYFPATERVVKEAGNKKTSIFKFVQWRALG